MSRRTKTRTKWTFKGMRYRSSCICGRSMRFYMGSISRDVWVGNHETGNWCDS